MPYRKKDASRQLSLSLSDQTQQKSNVLKSRTSDVIVHFVDAATLSVRRDAIQRVKAAGIFAISSKSKLNK